MEIIEKDGEKSILELYNRIMNESKIPDFWRKSYLTPIYKNKVDIQVCGNYRSIKLINYIMNMWEKVVDKC